MQHLFNKSPLAERHITNINDDRKLQVTPELSTYYSCQLTIFISDACTSIGQFVSQTIYLLNKCLSENCLGQNAYQAKCLLDKCVFGLMSFGQMLLDKYLSDKSVWTNIFQTSVFHTNVFRQHSWTICLSDKWFSDKRHGVKVFFFPVD